MMTVETKPANFKQEMLAAFKVFDKDSSGTIDAHEISKVMESFGEKLSDEELLMKKLTRMAMGLLVVHSHATAGWALIGSITD
jgi:Ca2+-binding EF-hand superfamily protein